MAYMCVHVCSWQKLSWLPATHTGLLGDNVNKVRLLSWPPFPLESFGAHSLVTSTVLGSEGIDYVGDSNPNVHRNI